MSSASARREGRGRGPEGGEGRGLKAAGCVGKCSFHQPRREAVPLDLPGRAYNSQEPSRPLGSPCAVRATFYPIGRGEGDVTCELVTYELLCRKLFNRIPLYPERGAVVPACGGRSGKRPPCRLPRAFLAGPRRLGRGWACALRAGAGARRALLLAARSRGPVGKY